ncbi:MAG: FG-GAP-like repeat-containing protein [Smithellaceae bacterium]
MRKYLHYIIIPVLMLLVSIPVEGKEKFTVTVLPFSVHSADNIDYVRQGIADMLSNRISASDQILIVRKDTVEEELKKFDAKDLTVSQVSAIGRSLKSDFVVWGSITKFGNSVSVDGKLFDVTAGKSDVNVSSQSQSLDDVIPKMNDFSQRIIGHIVGQSPATTGTSAPATPAPSRESQIIAGMKTGGKRGTLTSVINPEFINAPDPLKRSGFWMSQHIRTEFKGMAIGDVNSDGSNEIVIIDQSNLYIYKKSPDGLKLLHQIKGQSYNNYVSVDVADINRDGTPEIIVTSLNRNLLDSFVVQFVDGQYKTIASDIRWFLRVLDTDSGVPMLLGQSYGIDKVFDTPIYEIVWRDGKYVEGPRQKIPMGLSIYGLALEPLTAGGTDKIIALDELDYLCIIEKTAKPMSRLQSFGFASEELLWRSDTPFGGSNNYIANVDRNDPSNTERSAFANTRILAYDTNQDGKKEFIIVKNLSAVGRIFKNIKLFTSSEVYNLEWDGMGLAENWRTKRINGYVADYAIKDVTNDGKPEVVLALVQSVGATVSNRSVIVVYELTAEQ